MTLKQKWLVVLSAGLFGVCFMGIVGAQTARSVTISWSAPTLATDGTPLTGTQSLTKYQVFLSTTSIPVTSSMAPTVEVQGSLQTVQSFNVPVGGTLFVRVKACNLQACSDFSNEVSKPFPATGPNPPTNVTVTLNP
jgi:hypothetical protein